MIFKQKDKQSTAEEKQKIIPNESKEINQTNKQPSQYQDIDQNTGRDNTKKKQVQDNQGEMHENLQEDGSNLLKQGPNTSKNIDERVINENTCHKLTEHPKR